MKINRLVELAKKRALEGANHALPLQTGLHPESKVWLPNWQSRHGWAKDSKLRISRVELGTHPSNPRKKQLE